MRKHVNSYEFEEATQVYKSMHTYIYIYLFYINADWLVGLFVDRSLFKITICTTFNYYILIKQKCIMTLVFKCCFVKTFQHNCVSYVLGHFRFSSQT
jgi:hypothetical protein